MHRATASLTLLLVGTLPLSGCCSFARLFCGPDDSEWVSVDHRTPRAAVKTLLEALRRDAPEIVYLSLSRRYRDDLKLDETLAELAWPRIKEQSPGLHLAGYAEVPEPTRVAPDRAEVVLDVEGYAVAVRLVRECSWQLRYERRGEDETGAVVYNTIEYGGRLPHLSEPLQLGPLPEEHPDYSEDQWWWRATLGPIRFEHFGTRDIPIDDVDAFGVVREWKIDHLATQTDG